MLLLHLKTVLRQLALPPADLLLLAAAGLLLQRRMRLGLALTWAALGALWLISTPVVAFGLTHLAERVPPLDPAHLPDAQAIVIIGGGGQRDWAAEYQSAAAGPELLERLAYGAYLARRTGLPILVSGFGIEAQAMRDTLRQNFGLSPRWIDDHAYDTFQNAQNSAALLHASGVERVLLVTRAAHMLRALHEFSATGLTVIAAPVGGGIRGAGEVWDYIPDAAGLKLSYQACYELLGELVREALSAAHLHRQASAA